MNLGIIGFGNLGKAFVKGIIKSGKYKPSEIYITAKTTETLEKAKQQLGVNICRDANSLVETCDIIIIVVKPDQAENILKQMDKFLIGNKIFISFMASITIEEMQNAFTNPVLLARAMPNLSVMNLQGVTGLYMPDYFDAANKECIKDLLTSVGNVIEVSEDQLDKVTALASCGLGFVSSFIEDFVDAGVRIGLAKDIATEIVLQTFIGAAKTIIAEKLHPEELKNMVATKGGSTIEGLIKLDEAEVNSTVYQALEAAYKKIKKMKPRCYP